MRVAHNARVLVADGRKLLFLRNEGDETHLNLIVEAHKEEENPKPHEQGTDAPGRSVASVGAARSAFSETDFHQLQEDRFAADAADMLKRRALDHEYDHLIVVAPPQTLGELRKHYHKEVEQRIAGELAKDLTNMPVDRIEEALQAAD